MAHDAHSSVWLADNPYLAPDATHTAGLSHSQHACCLKDDFHCAPPTSRLPNA